VAILLLKLTLTPVLIGAASVVARRWGPSVGGWMAALPLTSGPVAFFLALEQGPTFGSRVALGSLAGMAAVAGFCLAYAVVGQRLGWLRSFAVGAAAFVAVAVAVESLTDGSRALLVAAVAAVLVAAVTLMPQLPEVSSPGAVPWWDIPARMAAGLAIVLVLTEAATVLGPGWTGVVAAFPVFVTVLTVFAHRHEGAPRALRVLRGVLVGLFGTATFYATLAVSLDPVGIAGAFGLAIAAVVAVQAGSFQVFRRSMGGS